MQLTPREKDKLLVSMAAIVARRRLERGVKLNHPEAMALITDYVIEGARDGKRGRRPDGDRRPCHHPRPGDGGHRRDDPRGAGGGHLPGWHQARHRPPAHPIGAAMIPGEVITKDGDIELNKGAATVTIEVANTGDRPIQVGSHYHFFETNEALRFDRDKARGHAPRHRGGHRRALRARPAARGDARALRRRAQGLRFPAEDHGGALTWPGFRAPPMPPCMAPPWATGCGSPTPNSSSRWRRTSPSMARR